MATPCWHCRHYLSIDTNTSIAACAVVGCMVKAQQGCGAWEREPGIDDDDWTPLPNRIAPWVPPEDPAPRDRDRDGWWTEPTRARRPGSAAPPAPAVPAARDVFWMFAQDDD